MNIDCVFLKSSSMRRIFFSQKKNKVSHENHLMMERENFLWIMKFYIETFWSLCEFRFLSPIWPKIHHFKQEPTIVNYKTPFWPKTHQVDLEYTILTQNTPLRTEKHPFDPKNINLTLNAPLWPRTHHRELKTPLWPKKTSI